MSVGGVQNTTQTNPNTNTNTVAPSQKVDKQDFLMLLVAELRNQDPTQPMDDREFISQLAQFNTLEQMQQMNATLTQSSELSVLGQLAGYIGKHVAALSSDGTSTIEGTVSGVTILDGNPTLTVDGQNVAVSSVFSITAPDATPDTSAPAPDAPSAPAQPDPATETQPTTPPPVG